MSNRLYEGRCTKCDEALYASDFVQDENGNRYCLACNEEANERERKYKELMKMRTPEMPWGAFIKEAEGE